MRNEILCIIVWCKYFCKLTLWVVQSKVHKRYRAKVLCQALIVVKSPTKDLRSKLLSVWCRILTQLSATASELSLYLITTTIWRQRDWRQPINCVLFALLQVALVMRARAICFSLFRQQCFRFARAISPPPYIRLL